MQVTGGVLLPVRRGGWGWEGAWAKGMRGDSIIGIMLLKLLTGHKLVQTKVYAIGTRSSSPNSMRGKLTGRVDKASILKQASLQV